MRHAHHLGRFCRSSPHGHTASALTLLAFIPRGCPHLSSRSRSCLPSASAAACTPRLRRLSAAAMADPKVERALAALQAASITIPPSHIIASHTAVVTSPEHLQLLSSHTAAQPAFTGLLAKNLFLKDKKTKALYLVTLLHSTQADYKTLGKLLGAKELRMEEALEEKLGVGRGSVTPLAVMNDSKGEVTLVVERRLAQDEQPILVHPLINTSTIAISWKDLQAFAKAHQHDVKIIDVPASEAPAGREEKEDGDAKQKAPPKAAAKPANAGKQKKEEKKEEEKKSGGGGRQQTTLGIDKKKQGEFASWYSQVVTRSELIEYYDISGCYILRPWSFSIWESIQAWFDKEIKKLGVKNAYFPLFVSRKALEAEKNHIEGFAPEVAWVTRSGDSELDEPIAVRPTSETIMYPAYAKWIRSHRDLPLKLNQWSNVVRWEFKFPTPFIRSREFLWQEGHTAFAKQEEADVEVLQILNLYAGVYEKLLAVPVTRGRKTESEKFAGGLYTTTVEAFIPATGRGIQGATSHCLGQNFAHMFEIKFEDEKGASQYAWQNSWGLTTRTIGVMVMVHSDDRGLVLPPMVAPLQVIFVPIFKKTMDLSVLLSTCRALKQRLLDVDIRADVDERDNYNPGWKFNHWELKGVCLRVEVGDNELTNHLVTVQRRDKQGKEHAVTFAADELEVRVRRMLDEMQADLLAKASAERDARRKQVTEWKDFMRALDNRNTALAPHCTGADCEKRIKQRSGEAAEVDQTPQEVDVEAEERADAKTEKLTGAAKSLCIPFEQPDLPEDTRCIGCEQLAKNWTLFGRSY